MSAQPNSSVSSSMHERQVMELGWPAKIDITLPSPSSEVVAIVKPTEHDSLGTNEAQAVRLEIKAYLPDQIDRPLQQILTVTGKNGALINSEVLNSLKAAIESCGNDLRAGVEEVLKLANQHNLRVHFGDPAEVSSAISHELAKKRGELVMGSPQLDAVLDPNMNCCTKSSIYSERHLAQMLGREGHHYFGFIDFSHMSVLNDVGLSNEVTKFLKAVSTLADRHFREFDSEFRADRDLFRIGGDELGVHLCMPRGAGADSVSKAFRTFKQKVAELKKELIGDANELSSSDPERALRILQAEHYAAYREEARTLLHKFQSIQKEAQTNISVVSIEGLRKYNDWLISEIRSHGSGASNKPDIKYIKPDSEKERDRDSLERLAARLELRYAKLLKGLDARVEVLAPRCAVIDLDSTHAVEAQVPIDSPIYRALTMSLAVGVADKWVHKIQRGEIVEDFQPHPIEDITLRNDERDEVAAINRQVVMVAETLTRINSESTNTIERVALFDRALLLLGSDPSVFGTHRLDRISHLPTSMHLPIEPGRTAEYTLVQFDIASAGAINNRGGYRKLDYIVAELAKMCPEFTIRANGGSIFMAIKGRPSEGQIDLIENKMNQFLKVQAQDIPYLRLEYFQKYQLRKMVQGAQAQQRRAAASEDTGDESMQSFSKFSVAKIAPKNFIVVRVQEKTINVNGSDTWRQTFDNWHSKQGR